MTATLRRIVLSLLIAIAAVAAPVAAEKQTEKQVPRATGIQERQPQALPGIDAASRGQLTAARKMVRRKNYEGAADLLEAIIAQEPHNQMALNLLRNCYVRLGQHGHAERVTRLLIETSPDSYALFAFLAESLVRLDRIDEAEAAYAEALSRVIKDDFQQYRQIVQSMARSGLNSQTLELISDLRTRLAQPEWYAREAGDIYEQQHEYEAAAREFLVASADTTRQGAEAESRLLNLLKFESSSGPAETTLRAAVGGPQAAQAARMLATHYMTAGDMDNAMRFVLLEDSLSGRNGIPLLNFLRICREKKLYTQATVVGRELLARYGDSPLLGEARFIYADALTGRGWYDSAIVVYDTIIASYPREQDRAEAGYRIGDIYLNYLLDYPAAITIFDSVTSSHRAGLGYLKASLAIPFCHLRTGDIDLARLRLTGLKNSRLSVDQKEMVDYYLAMLSFFSKEYDSTETALNRLLVEYPRGFYFNDALQLMLVLDEAGGDPDLLYDWSNALLFAERRMPDSVAARLLQIADNDNPALADVALYRLVNLSIEQTDSVSALDYIDSLEARFPESYYVPFGLKLKGEMFLGDPNRQQDGKKLYRRLLESYPNYPFISDVRKTLRALEDTRIG